MKCLSLWQPWASLIVGGVKRVESRSWYMRHRGPLLIHAAKKWTPELGTVAAGFFYRRALERLGFVLTADEAAAMRGWGMPFGAIVGRVDVIGCTVVRDCDEQLDGPRLTEDGRVGLTIPERLFGDYEDEGRFAILTANPVRFGAPIPYRGSQGLFDVPDSLADGAA